MLEAVLSSSVLILVVVGLRYLLRGRIHSWLQYALWGLVAIRLLLPFSLLQSPVSVMNLLNGIGDEVSQKSLYITEDASRVVLRDDRVMTEPNNYGDPVLLSGDGTAIRYTDKITLRELAAMLWLSGMTVAGAALVISNLRFAGKLKRRSTPLEIPHCPLSVRMADGLPSPCLYGLPRPTIYLTPESLEDEKRLEHILAHELTHYHHLDHVWSLLRGICIVVHWFNPLVWLAAALSRRDCELACDEGALRLLGEESRLEYGRTLIGLMTVRSTPADLLCAATTMTGGKRGIRERITLIAKKPRMLAVTLAAVVLAALIAAGCTFTGAQAAGRLSPSEALDRLEAGIAYENGELSLTLPEGYPDASNWNLHIAGRQEYEDGFSRSVHYLEEENEARSWIAGQRYVILSGDVSAFTELTLTAFLPDGDGQTLERTVDLLPILHREATAEDVGYTLTKLGKNGEALASRILSDESERDLAKNIIMNALLKSAAWPGVDPASLEECWRIRQTYPSGETHDYYAYVMDGKSVLQMGHDGMFIGIDFSLYTSLTALIDRSRDLEASVSDAILSHNADRYGGGEFKTESHVVLKTVEKKNSATVYLMAYYAEYNFPDGVPEQAGGSHVPCALTFRKDDRGAYTLTEYWEASDGTGYARSIRNKFPSDVAEAAMDTQLYVKEQSEACDQAAQEYLCSRLSEEELLDVIVSGPQEASMVYAYIKNHQMEYDELLSRGDTTLRFIYAECLKGGQNDLRSVVMMTMLPELMGEEYVPGDADTLQEWFDGFLARTMGTRPQIVDKDMEKHQPKAWLLKELIGE